MVFQWNLSEIKSPHVSRGYSLYSSRSQQYGSVDGHDYHTDFKFPRSLLQDPGDRSGRAKYKLYYPEP